MFSHLRIIPFRLKVEVKMKRLGKEILYTGDAIPLDPTEELELPDVIIGTLGTDVTKRTLLIYGHVDVKPVYEDENWTHDAFDMQIKGDYMYGRGVTDDKGPLLGWLNVIEVFQVSMIVKAI